MAIEYLLLMKYTYKYKIKAKTYLTYVKEAPSHNANILLKYGAPPNARPPQQVLDKYLSR